MLKQNAIGIPISGALILLSATIASAAVENWADPALSLRTGLVIWLDASRQEVGWKSHGKPPLLSSSRLDVWYDASGNGLHFVQRLQHAQPRYIAPGAGRAVVRFNGLESFLERTAVSRQVDAFTVFLVAAPRTNAGGFRGFLAAHQTGQNDYTTGFNIDMNAESSDRLRQLNIEGKGFRGARNLMSTAMPFGEFHTITVTCRAGENGVRLFVDGKPAGERQREPGPLHLDHLVLGARCYSNTAQPPYVSGFFDGDIAEVMLYHRVLDDQELWAVNDYLARKHAGLSQTIAAADLQGGYLLKPMADPPPVQMLVPGFTVHQLPVDLTNINNVRYRPDGKLLALGYSGDVYLLSDTDGDGLEDKVERFWESKGRLRGPIGIALTPPGYKHGDGLFVASKGKLSLIVDTDGDDKADKEIIVAQGWKEIPHNVDACGVALAKDGSVYFGLGTANYANPYLLDDQGKGHYDVKSERGTILKVSPDFQKRDIVCTGIRFPVGMAFNQHGDLFTTDQEGATWLPNGNPFDELLHIEPGRHYGFPPRHPKHLPGVVDEPSVFDYGPQHQSTCGLAFNPSPHADRGDSKANGIFGPAWWAGDAIITGESRGKLFRTKLVKTANGYVAQNQILACLKMLAVDACVSPQGDIVVACHSGPPDWGTGPLGKGRLYKIRYHEKTAPQPALAWAAGPREVRVAFDRALDPLLLQNLQKQLSIEYGLYVRPGDRFEVLKPPYAVVQQQMATPRHSLPVLSAQVTSDRRTLVLATEPHPQAVSYSLTLPGLGRPATSTFSSRGGEGRVRGRTDELRQLPSIDLGYDLSGVEATWKPQSADAGWSGWLPHLDLNVARVLTVGSAEHDRLWEAMKQPGRITLRTQVDLWSLLRPALQVGTHLDHTPPPEQVTLTFRAAGPITVKTTAGSPSTATTPDGHRLAQLKLTPKEGELVPVEIVLEANRPAQSLEVWFATAEDERPRALPLRRFLLPWATLKSQPETRVAKQQVPELQGGNWVRGRQVFFGEPAGCSKCHQVRGQGGQIGPDLSNLVHRDYASVLRDIVEPSAALNPDYLTYVIELKGGRVLTGVPRSADADHFVIGDNAGKEVTVARAQIATMQPSPVSTMPNDLAKAMGPERLRDLMTFLLTEPLVPAPLERADAPLPRRRAEIDAILKGAAKPTEAPRKRHIVLVAGPKDHGPGEHDYPLWQRRWSNLLELAEAVTVSTASGWPSPRQWERADLVILYSANPAWSAEKAGEVDAYLNRGGGLVLLHYAVNGRDAADAWAERIGLAWRAGQSRFRHGPLDVKFADAKHPLTRGFGTVKFVDESYWQLAGDPKKVEILATAVEDGRPQPLLWTQRRGQGRVFVSLLGHYTWTFDDPLFRIVLLRGMAWAAGEPADRWTDLAAIGARIRD
jgi:putative heme-binding domain-containing protein